MTYDPSRHHRRSIRLRGYDYSQPGAYFVTICVEGREHLFGDVIDGVFQPNRFGHIVRAALTSLPRRYPHLRLDAFVIMPNHVHVIFVLLAVPQTDAASDQAVKPTPVRHSLSEIIRGFKTESARKINRLRKTQGLPVWQRNYYEHIVRDDRALNAIRRYIIDNPLRWHLDRLNAGATGPDQQAAQIWQMIRDDQV